MNETKNQPLTPAKALRLFRDATHITLDAEGEVYWWTGKPVYLSGHGLWVSAEALVRRLGFLISSKDAKNIAWPDGCNIWPMEDEE